ncbi:Protease synthase and sporulation negative regulatory protein PAI 1 [Luteitalea pratensis]|uniref:Protease synthase and sporulation negative regulatory protein PAI 1 n=1 Tax=Luteitalea pratensis TaxID=1855912 RepID=A0A143PSR7_LUTPR|nr:GNAT family N-acetyltransferase [Luteitalea pratensis]AMY11777.1 Protease synthase and sporulation negative regulatory protein PAI 1 [Luteitalea pratensis]
MTCVVRPGAIADAERLAAFGHRVFAATFAADNDPAQLARYVDAAYTPAVQAAELADAAIATWLACDADDRLLGFAQVRLGPAPASVTGPSPLELWRLYVDHEWHGRGVAADLMQTVCEHAARERAGVLWLGVWERNPRAQAFYRKHGFVPIGAHVFMFGTEEQTDQIWVRAL